MEFRSTNKLPTEDVGALGVPVCCDDLGSPSPLINWAFLAERGFEGKPGETLAIPGDGSRTVIALGVGERAAVTPDVLRQAAAAFVRASWRQPAVTTTLLEVAPDGLDRGRAAQAIAEGAVLGSYRYDRYKGDPKECSVETLTVVGTGGKKVTAGLDRGRAIGEAVVLARDLANEPAATLTPRQFVEVAAQVAERENLRMSVLDEVDIEAANLGGLLAVSKGSAEPARLLQLTYEPDSKARSTIAFVGKGITFDSGGLSIKTAEGMLTMKTDMSGAAAVLGAMSALRAAGCRHRVIGIMPLTENMPSGTAIRPGDVLTIRNGKTVEIINTDAEGRVVLADALSLAAEESPDAIIDVATLTGACTIALGPTIAGLMGNHDAWVHQVGDAARRAGEPVWHLPLPPEYRRLIEAEVGDLRNQGKGGKGGALTAALFLQEFVGDVPWAHLDIAGPARADEDDGATTPIGGTGFGVRTLIEAATGFHKPARAHG